MMERTLTRCAPSAVTVMVMSSGVMPGSSAERLVLYGRLAKEAKLMAMVAVKRTTWMRIVETLIETGLRAVTV